VSKKLEKLKTAKTNSDLAKLLGFKPKALTYLLYKSPSKTKYKKFSIPKRNGQLREIMAPNRRLKLLQKRTNLLLSDCSKFIEEKQINKSTRVISHGFKKGYSIATNAEIHKNRRWVFNVDIKDFFPSINFGRVRGYFIKNRNFELDPKIATALARISCHDNQLPQGSPSSPIISNLIAHILDIHLSKLATSNGCSYSRYADDLTFSTNKKTFPEQIAYTLPGNPHKWLPGNQLKSSIYRSGFKLNRKKTRMQYTWSRQDATGLIVNKKVNIRKEYFAQARVMCDSLFKTGFCYRKTLVDGEDEISILSPAQITGVMNYIYKIKSIKRPIIKNIKPCDLPSDYKLYRSLLDYFSFFANKNPTIICEGKTDNIYIKLSLQQMYKKFPKLIIKTKGRVGFSYNFRLFNYTKNTNEIQALGGGTAQLKQLIYRYEEIVSTYSAKGLQNPVILIVDNDQGSTGTKSLFSAIKKVSKSQTSIDGTQPFYKVISNLYVIPTPKGDDGLDTMIESFLPDKWLKTKLKGKSLYLNKSGFDEKKHYGKTYLAKYVIAKNANKVDFSGFTKLLRTIESVIVDHKKSQVKALKPASKPKPKSPSA